MTLDEAKRELVKFVKLKTTQQPAFLSVILEALPKTGKWEERIVEDPVNDPYNVFRRRWYCSACGQWNSHGAAKFCMRCGARMENGRGAE